MDNYIQQFKNGETICINSNSVKLQYNLVCAYNNVTLHTSVLYRFTEQDRWLQIAKYINYYDSTISQSIEIPTSTSGKVYLKNLNSDGYLYDLEIITNNSVVDNTTSIMNTILSGKDYIYKEVYQSSTNDSSSNNPTPNNPTPNDDTNTTVHTINSDYKNIPLTLQILSSGKVTFHNDYPGNNSYISYIDYKVNNSEYRQIYSDGFINVNENDIIEIKDTNVKFTYINSTSYFNAYGNVHNNSLTFKNCDTLLSAENLVSINIDDPNNEWFDGFNENIFYNCINLITPPKQEYNDVYYTSPYMFYNCKNITTINHNKIEITPHCFDGCSLLDNINEILISDGGHLKGYGGGTYAFNNCISLKHINKIILSTLGNACSGALDGLFCECISLETPPILTIDNKYNGCIWISLQSMFKDCTSLKTPLIIPNLNGIKLYNTSAYIENMLVTDGTLCPDMRSMYCGCTSLTTAPELPYTTLFNYCYDTMFYGCTSLITAPELPAELLKYGCYDNMFTGCTLLVNAPKLKSKHLDEKCYSAMFRNCTSLNKLVLLCNSIGKSGINRTSMFDGVAEIGILYKDQNVDESLFVDLIPEGWTIENYVE